MKFFYLLCFSLLLAVNLMAQDTIPNAGFEYWNYVSNPGYYNPDDWTTLNPITEILEVYTATRDSVIVHSGQYSIKLTTLSVAGQTAPGTLTTGTFNTVNHTIYGGIGINSRPSAITGWYQYIPVGSDSAGFNVTLTKWDATGDSEIQVGFGGGYAGTKDTVWTAFTAPINYTSNATPDTVLLIFTSGASVAPQVGSTLWLDDLSYQYSSGIAEVQTLPINIYPNPASRQINMDNQTAHISSLNLYSSDGKLVNVVKLSVGLNTIDISTLAAGVYVVSGLGADGTMYRSNVVIDK